MKENGKPTLAGRILRGVLRGVIDGLPGVSQVANVIRQHQAEKREAEQVPSDEPVTRTVTGWLTLAGVVLGFGSALAGGSLDCESLRAILQFFGLVP